MPRPLPEPEDVEIARCAINARMAAALHDDEYLDHRTSAKVTIRANHGSDAIPRLLYGDLFDHDKVAGTALALYLDIRPFVAEGAMNAGEMTVAIGVQMAALGVLMERARWEREDG